MVISWTITIETNTTGRFNFALSSEKHVENMALTNLAHCALQRTCVIPSGLVTLGVGKCVRVVYSRCWSTQHQQLYPSSWCQQRSTYKGREIF